MTGMELKERQGNLLNMLNGVLEEQGLEPEFEKDEAGNDVLLCSYDDLLGNGEEALGAFYFMPPEEGEEYLLHFQTAITIDDEVEADAAIMLKSAIARLNFFQPYGSFILSPDGEVLTFRNEQGIPLMLGDEQQAQLMFYYVTLAAEVVRLWGDTLRRLMTGDLTMSEFEKNLKVEVPKDKE